MKEGIKDHKDLVTNYSVNLTISKHELNKKDRKAYDEYRSFSSWFNGSLDNAIDESLRDIEDWMKRLIQSDEALFKRLRIDTIHVSKFKSIGRHYKGSKDKLNESDLKRKSSVYLTREVKISKHLRHEFNELKKEIRAEHLEKLKDDSNYRSVYDLKHGKFKGSLE